MTTEVLNTGYVETGDDGVTTTGILQETASRVSFTAMPRNAERSLTKDFGAGYFSGSAYAEGEINISAITGTAGKSVVISFCSSTTSYPTVVSEAGFDYFANTGTGTGSLLRAWLTESSTPTVSTALSSVTVGATVYYYRVGFYSSLGQYGGLVLQVFSEPGRATLLGTAILLRTAATTYQFFNAAAGVSGGSADTLTGYNDNITLYRPTAGLDLTTGVETDTGTGRLVVYADTIVATALNIANSETAKHVVIDEGAGFFGDYTVSGVLNITAFANGSAVGMFQVLTVCDAASDAAIANDSQGIVINWVSATTYQIQMHQSVVGTDTFSSTAPPALTLNVNQPYSVTLSRSGTTLTLKIWNDLVLDANMQGTSQVGSTVTWTGRATTTYRYLMPVTSYLTGATSRSSTFTLGGVKRTGGVNSASYTSDGGFVIGGSATNSRSAYATGSGGILLGGSATHSRSTAYIATGGFIIGGSADFSANGAQSVSYTSAGGFIIGGTAANSRSSSHTGSGGFRLGGSAAYSFTLQTNVQEIVFELYDSTGAPITGATTITCKLRTTPGAQIYDWSDDTFKSSGWTTISADLNEIDATNLPGVYKKEIDVSNFTDGRYQVFISYSATQSQHGSVEFLIDDGQMVDEYTATNTHTALIDIAALPTAAENATEVNALTVGQFLALK